MSEKDKKERKINVNIYFDPSMVNEIKRLWQNSGGKYASRSDVVRQAVKEFLEARGYPRK